MVNSLNNREIMNNERNINGQFSKGHNGFKPKGAVSRKKQKRDELLEHIFNLLDGTIEEDMNKLTPKQSIRFWLELTKLTIPKLRRIPYIPQQAENSQPKCSFTLINTDSQLKTPPHTFEPLNA